jgi:hypothetical protein
MMVRKTLFLLLLASLAASTPAAVFVVPSDVELVRDARAIVLGRVDSIQPILRDDGMIETEVSLSVDEWLKGTGGGQLTLVEAGGIVGGRAVIRSGVPRFTPNERVLVFLTRDGHGRWTTFGMSLGRFTQATTEEGESVFARFVEDDPPLLYTAEWRTASESPRLASEFLAFIRASTGRRRAVAPAAPISEDGICCVAKSAVARPSRRTADHHVPASAYVMPTFRWTRFDNGQSVAYISSGSQPGYDWLGAISRGMAAWNNDPGSNVNLVYAGAGSAPFAQDGVNAIVLNSATGVPAGAAGYAQIFASGQHVYKGETFWSISEGDVVIRNNLTFSQTVFDEIVTHELGHSIGFRHSTDRPPTSNDAIMYPTASGRFGPNLQAWDRDALSHVYTGSGGGCTPSFNDVPCNHPFFSQIETVRRNGITAGCAPSLFCPDTSVSRAQMAVFLLTAKYGSAYRPPAASGTMFSDVPANSFAAAWIEQLVREGVTAGCGAGRYCPNNAVTRAEMAVFLLAAKYGAAYRPPAATGAMFVDVPANSFAAAWIEQLVREGITAGCAPSQYCPNAAVTRGQMSVFLVATFGLQ